MTNSTKFRMISKNIFISTGVVSPKMVFQVDAEGLNPHWHFFLWIIPAVRSLELNYEN